jgi:hypothetical protein
MDTLTKLISSHLDGETMQQIIKEFAMEEQMLRQLVMSMPTELTQQILEEKKSLRTDDIVTLERGSEDELKMRMSADRDTLLIEVSGDTYNYLMEDYADELSGMLGISDYIVNVVDEVLSSDEYKSAVQYERDGKGTRWDYMHIEHENCLDWFFLDKANAIINEDYPRLNKES